MPLVFILVIAATFFAQHPAMDLFSRELMSFEDHSSLLPLFKISWAEYLFHWSSDGFHFVFPLADWTFLLDHHLSEALSVPTFWISQWLWFALYLFVVYRLLVRVESHRARLLGLFVLLCLHPMNVQVVQWITFRRPILVAILCLLATSRVLDLSVQKRIATRDLVLPFVLWAVSPLCYMDGILWIFGMLYLLYPQLEKKRLAGATIAALTMIYAYISLITRHDEYQTDFGTVFSRRFLDHLTYLGPRVLGRGTLNLIFPYRPSLYYNELSPVYLCGLGLFMLVVALLVRRWRSGEMARVERAFWLWSFLVFSPHCLAMLAREEFVLADRYLFLTLPYFLVACWLSFGAQTMEYLRPRVSKRVAWATFASLVFFWVAVTTRAATRWHDSRSLARACAEEEGAPKCLIYALQPYVSKANCTEAEGLLERARAIYRTERLPFSFSFTADFPFFDGVCVLADPRMAFSTKRERLEQNQALYGTHATTVMPLVLLDLHESRLADAYSRAQAYLPSPDHQIADLYSVQFAAILVGHADALCRIQGSQTCRDSATALTQRFWPLSGDTERRNWGYTATMLAARAISTRREP